MSNVFMRFPGGVGKALTLSYDDGVEQDIKLMEILDRYGIKCTFNINSGRFVPEDKVYDEGQIHRIMSKSRVLETYKDSGHEVAVHALTHAWLDCIPAAEVAREVIEDRKNLEEMFGMPIRGMAYPYGATDDTVVEVLKNSGIVYSRTTVSTEKFGIPTDWLRLSATCHHKNARLGELAEKFVQMKVPNRPQLFYLWGHSYEFEKDNNWNVIEQFCETVGGKEDIWYATNIEIYDYIQAYDRLIWAVDYRMVANPSAIPVWFTLNISGQTPVTVKVDAGETLAL